jgi:hypothetical protein
MVRRLLLGLVKGTLIGGIFAVVLIQVLGLPVLGAFVAYAAAVLVGAVTGLIAGKPFWTKDARIEVILKAVVGAAIAAAVMFALRKWLPAQIDLSAIGAGTGAIGSLAALSLPLIATFLAVVFEVDNTTDVPATDERAAIAAPKQRVTDDEQDLAVLEDEDSNQIDYTESRRKR